MYDKLVTEVNAIVNKVLSTSGLVSKTYYDSDKQNFEKKIENLNKKILNTRGLIEKLLITQNVQRLKTSNLRYWFG